MELCDWALDKHIIPLGDLRDINEMIVKGNLLMVAQELQERIEPLDIGEFLRSVFGDSSVRPSDAHILLPRIPFRAVLTTNYDSLIEDAYRDAYTRDGKKAPEPFTQEDLAERRSPLRRDDFFIFKLHGHFSRPSTVVLGSRDYQHLLFRTPGYRQFLETLFSTHTVIFVGFGGSDPDLDNVLDRLSSVYSRTLDRHYILLPSGEMNHTEKRRLALDKGLEVIDYDSSIDHTQIEAFLREVISQVESEPGETFSYFRDEPGELKVIILGSTEDNARLVSISDFLLSRDYSAWPESEEAESDETRTRRITAIIRDADRMIVIFSESFAKSTLIEYAISRRDMKDGAFIIPIVVGKCELPDYFSGRSHIKLDDAFDDRDLLPLLDILPKST